MPQNPTLGPQTYHGRASIRSYTGAFALAALCFVVGLFFLLLRRELAPALLSVVLGSTSIAYAVLSAFATDYLVTPTHVESSRGIFSRSRAEAEFETVREIVVLRRPLDRQLGVGTVCLGTVGQDGHPIRFHGVSRPEQLARWLERLRDQHAPPL